MATKTTTTTRRRPKARAPVTVASPTAPLPKGKLGVLVQLLSRPEGATLDALIAASGWQAHSVRGAISGSLKKKLGFLIRSTKTDDVRVYRIEPAAADSADEAGA